MQTRIVTLLTQWKISGQERFRRAAIRHVREMARWKYWSWITWRRNDPRPDAIFDLSYGENSATLAIAYDWLQPALAPGEKSLFLGLAEKWCFAAFLKTDKPVHKDFWFKHPGSNWNTVCAGGAGMLALALMDERPALCRRVLKRAEESIVPFMKTLDKTSGGWPEGIGYWGYGMRYAFMYLLSWENAFRRAHPLMRSRNVRRTLDFPLDFMPNNEPVSFGDVNTYWILPFHYAAAARLKRPDVVRILDRLILARPDKIFTDSESWPSLAELLVFHPGKAAPGRPDKAARLSAYPGLDWFTLRDQWPSPELCLSIRGGTTEVNHGHLDLTSFQLVVKDETLIHNVCQQAYLDSTFGPRRFEIPEMTPPCKNVLLINGVGIARPSIVESRTLTISGLPGVRINATAAMGAMRDGPAVKFYARLFILLGPGAALVLDRAVLPHPGRVETRLHTFARLAVGRRFAGIQGSRQSLRVHFDASEPFVLESGSPVLTDPCRRLSTLRLCTGKLVTGLTLATLLTAGRAAGRVSLKTVKNGLWVRVDAAGKKRVLKLTEKLLPG
jgi:hypothetical protein